MRKTVTIGGNKIELLASVWTWIIYKNIFKRDWNSDKEKSMAEIKKAYLFSQEFDGLTDEQFKKLPKEKQEAYWKGANENTVDLSFALDTIFAMAVAGGFTGTQKDLFADLSPKDLNPESELMKIFTELSEEFNIEVKKKTLHTTKTK